MSVITSVNSTRDNISANKQLKHIKVFQYAIYLSYLNISSVVKHFSYHLLHL